MYNASFKIQSCRLWVAAALATLAIGCAAEPEDVSEDVGDETLSQVSLDAGRVSPDAGTTDAAVKVDGGTTADGGAAAAASFCDVLAIIKPRCQACHDTETAAGAPMPLVTWEDFQAEAILTPGKKVFEVTQSRMKDTRRPMPPRGVRPAAELAVIDAWVAAGAPKPAKPCP
ncbi:MAG: hypothetical protein ABW252_14320 [Polyangiales bacterium]